MRLVAVLFALLVAAFAPASAQTAPADHGAKVYQRCAACHLPNGQGVPGAFPALAGRLDGAAATDDGRAYLVMTISAGLMGEIEVDGKTYRGVMPAQAGLSDADLAAVLNYALTLKGGAGAPAKPPKSFTAEEVAAIRKKIATPTPRTVHAMRAAAFTPEAAPAK